jgi:amidohydrolase
METDGSYADLAFKRLHQTPEPGLKEYKTSQFLADELVKFGYQVDRDVGATGVVGTLDSHHTGPVLGVRADMDALPFDINGQKRYIHACGHDAHCAMVLSAAKTVSEKGILRGKLKIIFQPAEETFEGAKLMIGSNTLQDLEELIGIHLREMDELRLGEANSAVYHAAAHRIKAVIKGKPAHGARPHLGVNTIEAAALAINAVNAVRMDPLIPHSAKVTQINSTGTAHNIIPDETHVVFDLRAQNNETMIDLIQKVKRAIVNSVGAIEAELALEDLGGALAAEYDDSMIKLAEEAIVDVLGNLKAPAVSPGSEDFHFFAKAYNLKSVYVGLGADPSPGLHHPEMFFDLSALEYGRKILEKMILKRLG